MPTGQASPYSRRYKIHAVALYLQSGSTGKTMKRLEVETRQGKWEYSTVPTVTTLLKWYRRYDPTMEDGEDDISIEKREDIEQLAIMRTVQNKVRLGLRSLEFTSIREILAGLSFIRKTRAEIYEKYKDDRNAYVNTLSADENEEKVEINPHSGIGYTKNFKSPVNLKSKNPKNPGIRDAKAIGGMVKDNQNRRDRLIDKNLRESTIAYIKDYERKTGTTL